MAPMNSNSITECKSKTGFLQAQGAAMKAAQSLKVQLTPQPPMAGRKDNIKRMLALCSLSTNTRGT